MRFPRGVNVVAIILIIFGVLGFFWGFVLVGVGGVTWLTGLVTFTGSAREWGGGAFLGGLLDIVTGILKIVAGVGLLARQFWAWVLAVILTVIWLIAPLVALFRGNVLALFGLIIPGAILVYLLSPRVRDAFNRIAF